MSAIFLQYYTAMCNVVTLQQCCKLLCCMGCDVNYFIFYNPPWVLERRMRGERKCRQKQVRKEILALGETGMEGVLARAAAKRRPSQDHEIGRQIRSFTYQFAKRQNNAKNACLIRHGPTSSPNGRGAGSMEQLIVLYEALEIQKFDKHDRIHIYERPTLK